MAVGSLLVLAAGTCYLAYCYVHNRQIISGWSNSVVLGVGGAFVVVILLGFAPRILSSTWARMLHFIDDVFFKVTGSRPFHFHRFGEKVILGRLPRTLQDIELLDKEGVKTYIVLNEEWELFVPLQVLRDRQYNVLHIPIPDYQAPTLAELKAAIDFLAAHADKEDSVYVHCNGGKGRSAVVVIAWLMQQHGWTKEQAFAHVRGIRNIANMPRLFGIFPQWRILAQFELLGQRARPAAKTE
eukprot:m.5653 g.5653  ORF g.5653 m.5653 type:complete len:241 (+) comp3658_c0_seq2:142-864(+)